MQQRIHPHLEHVCNVDGYSKTSNNAHRGLALLVMSLILQHCFVTFGLLSGFFWGGGPSPFLGYISDMQLLLLFFCSAATSCHSSCCCCCCCCCCPQLLSHATAHHKHEFAATAAAAAALGAAGDADADADACAAEYDDGDDVCDEFYDDAAVRVPAASACGERMESVSHVRYPSQPLRKPWNKPDTRQIQPLYVSPFSVRHTCAPRERFLLTHISGHAQCMATTPIG